MSKGDTSRKNERLTTRDLMVLVLSVFVLFLLAIDVFAPIDEATRDILYAADSIVCVFFLSDFFVGLYRAKSKLAYLKRNWIDFVSSVPMVPYVRLGRLLRVLRLFRLLRAYRSSHRLMQYILLHRQSSTFAAAIALTFMVVVLSSISMLEVEKLPESNIKTAGDAIWWSLTTMTTVGYGDKFPVSTPGRVIALFPMLCGIGIFGLVTSVIAAWFLKPAEQEQSREIDEITARLDRIEKLLERLVGSANPCDQPDCPDEIPRNLG